MLVATGPHEGRHHTKAVALERDTLSAVLDAFVQSGLLVVRREGGILVYQARPGAG